MLCIIHVYGYDSRFNVEVGYLHKEVINEKEGFAIVQKNELYQLKPFEISHNVGSLASRPILGYAILQRNNGA